MTKSQHAGVLKVADALAAAGATGEVVELAAEVRTAALAAEALGVEVGAIANSLVFDADGEPLLVLTSGAHRVDTAKVAALLGVRALRRATPEFVRSRPGRRSAASPRSGTRRRCARWSTSCSPTTTWSGPPAGCRTWSSRRRTTSWSGSPAGTPAEVG